MGGYVKGGVGWLAMMSWMDILEPLCHVFRKECSGILWKVFVLFWVFSLNNSMFFHLEHIKTTVDVLWNVFHPKHKMTEVHLSPSKNIQVLELFQNQQNKPQQHLQKELLAVLKTSRYPIWVSFPCWQILVGYLLTSPLFTKDSEGGTREKRWTQDGK